MAECLASSLPQISIGQILRLLKDTDVDIKDEDGLTLILIFLSIRNKVIDSKTSQNQPSDVFYKKGILKNSAKLIGKHLC